MGRRGGARGAPRRAAAAALTAEIARFKGSFQTSDGKLLAGREEHQALAEDEVEQEQIVRQKRS